MLPTRAKCITLTCTRRRQAVSRFVSDEPRRADHQYLITDTGEEAGIKKRVSAQILRDTCAVRQLRRGDEIEKVLQRLGLSETTWEDARMKYMKLSAEGI